MIAFINDHREAYGIEPICKVLLIAPSTYHDHVAKRLDFLRLSDRAKRDEALKIEVRRVFEENFRVYGARKVWRQLRREGFTIARCTVERLMASLGLQGVIRGKPVRTTISDKSAACPLDHVNRQFQASRPNALWVSDFTYVATWTGFVYVAFETVEFATLEWVDWFNNRRLLEPIVTYRRPKPSNVTTPCWTNQPWPHNLNQIASGKPGAVQCSCANAFMRSRRPRSSLRLVS